MPTKTDPHAVLCHVSCVLPPRCRIVVGCRMSPIRVIVVEDFVPFREFICKTLAKWPNFQVICEVSDGLEAIQKTEQLKPDLILLDIGLPTLNGIEVARRIRKLSPESRILFVSQESAADVVQIALSTGAAGYVVKTRVASDLLSAVKAVTERSIAPL